MLAYYCLLKTLQVSPDGNITTSTLMFKPTLLDHEKTLTCRADNSRVQAGAQEDSWKLSVYCKCLVAVGKWVVSIVTLRWLKFKDFTVGKAFLWLLKSSRQLTKLFLDFKTQTRSKCIAHLFILIDKKYKCY